MANALQNLRNRNLPSTLVGDSNILPQDEQANPFADPVHPQSDASVKYGQVPPVADAPKSPVEDSMTWFTDDGTPTGNFTGPQTETPTGTPPYNPDAPKDVEKQSSIIQNQILSPYMAQIRANDEKIRLLQTQPVVDRDGIARSGYKAFFMAGRQNPALMNARNWGDLGKGIAQMFGAGVGGAINKTWNEEVQRSTEIAKLQDQNKQIANTADFESKMLTSEAQRKNIEHDNAIQDELAITRNRREAMKQFLKTGFDPNKPTEAQLRILEMAKWTPQDVGEVSQVGGKTMKIGGTVFEKNNTTGQYEETNLPSDKPKQFTTLTVRDVEGNEVGTYNVTNDRAAQFTVDMVTKGYSVKLDNVKLLAAVKARNLEKKNKWQAEKIETQNKRNKNAAEISEKQVLAENLTKSNNTLREELQSLNPRKDADKTRISQINQQIEQNDSAFLKLDGEIKGLQGEKILDPPEPQYEDENIELPSNTGMVTTGGSNLRLTADEIRANGKKLGKSETEINAKISEWKAKGLLIQ